MNSACKVKHTSVCESLHLIGLNCSVTPDYDGIERDIPGSLCPFMAVVKQFALQPLSGCLTYFDRLPVLIIEEDTPNSKSAQVSSPAQRMLS